MKPPVPELTERQRQLFELKLDKSTHPKGCFIWTAFCNPDGYGEFRIGRFMYGAHRVAYRIARGPVEDGQRVLHTCDNPPCCNPAHLWIGTQTQNIADMDQKVRRNSAFGNLNGTHTHPETVTRGVNIALAKLDDEKVREIRTLYAQGHPSRALGRRFGVNKSAILLAVKRRTWRHVP